MSKSEMLGPIVVIGPGEIPCPPGMGITLAQLPAAKLRKYASRKPLFRPPNRFKQRKKGPDPEGPKE